VGARVSSPVNGKASAAPLRDLLRNSEKEFGYDLSQSESPRIQHNSEILLEVVTLKKYALIIVDMIMIM